MKPSFVSIRNPSTCHEDRNARSPSFFSDRDLVRVSGDLLAELKDLAARTGGYARLCLHDSPEAALHDSILVIMRDRYFPPHLHPNKAETFQLLEGETLFVVFDDSGRVIDVCHLDRRDAFVYRVGPGHYHTNLPLTPQVVVRECSVGPFVRERDEVFAPWAPDPSDREAYLAYRDRLLEDNLDES